jgi:hypothetical protein
MGELMTYVLMILFVTDVFDGIFSGYFSYIRH